MTLFILLTVAAFRWFVLFVIAVSLLHKLADMQKLTSTIRDYNILPAGISGPAAYGVVALEAAILVMIAAQPQIGMLAAAALFVLYGAAIGVNLLRGRRRIDCGCSLTQQASSGIGIGMVIRNAFLCVGAVCSSYLSLGFLAESLQINLMSISAAVILFVLYCVSDRALSFGLRQRGLV